MIGEVAQSERLVEEIQRRILVGEIAIGAHLRHGPLAEEFGVSRTPVREALRVLHARGIVEIEPHKGARVRGHSPRDLRELGLVRAELEGLAAESAAQHIRDDQLERLQGAWIGYRDAIDSFVGLERGERTDAAGVHWVRANDEFHRVVWEASANRQLQLSIVQLHQRLPRNVSFAAYREDSRLLRSNVEEHEAIAAAIAARDGERARLAMRDHVRSSSESLVRWFESR